MRFRIAARTAMAVTVTLGISLVSLEVAVRFLRLAPPLTTGYGGNVLDPYLPFRPAPFSVERRLTDGIEHVYRRNSFGLRDVEHSLEKPADSFRILGLGDSFTYGVGAAFEATYLYRLEHQLNRRSGGHPRVEIVKAGIPRSYPETQAAFLEHYGVSYAPDLILVAFEPNDVIDTYFGRAAIVVDKSGYLTTREAADMGESAAFFYTESHVLRIILSKYVSYRIATKYPVHWDDVFRPHGYHEAQWLQIEGDFARMVDVVRHIGATIVFIHIPQAGPWREHHSYPPARLAAWSARAGVAFVDILPAMKAAPLNEALYYAIDGHCTPAGYAIVATELAAYLTSRCLIP